MEQTDDIIEAIAQQVSLLSRRFDRLRNVVSSVAVLERSAYPLLARLAAEGPQSVGTLADTFHLDISTVSRQIASLEAKGLLERVSDPKDGRVSRVIISDAGKQRLNEYRGAYYASFTNMIAHWSDNDRNHFLQLLERLNREMENQLTRDHQ